jgi:hypothetical protein
LGVGLLTAAAITVVPTPAYAAPSTLGKSVQNITHPRANPANHGDTLNWVLDYGVTGPPGPATITDPIAGGQSYVPGSLHVPPGWTPQWSTDGTTFAPTEPGAGTVAVRATTPAARPGGTTLDTPLQPPVQASPVQTGGDGFTPILQRTAAGTTEVWNMYHHLNTVAPKLVCTDLATNALCAGGPWPKPVNTTPGPFGAGNTGDIASTLFSNYVRDPDTGVIYYPGVAGTSVGVGCLDLAARANCGFWPLAGTGTIRGLTGFVTTGGNVYGLGANGQVLCLGMASHTPCAGQPYAPIVPPSFNNPGDNPHATVVLVEGKMFASAGASGAAPMLGCFDPATQSTCTGWSTPKPVGPVGSDAYSTFTAFDTAGVPVGACAAAWSNVKPVTTCFTVAGASLTAPTVLTSLTNGDYVFQPEVVIAPDGHVRSYFAAWRGSPGQTVCYDWNTAASCAGFPLPAPHPTVNGGATRDYGYTYDSTTDCLIALGDAGVLFSIDPATGGSPCIHSGASAALHPAAFYCDGGTGHVQGYRDARLENINLANVNLAASTVEVRDTGGGPISTPGLAGDGTVDLSGISVAAHPDITVTTSLVLNNGSDFTGTNHPTMVLSYDGDAPQVCFQTTVAADCAATGVANTATGADAAGGFTSNTVNLAVAPGSACQPNVTVNKEICGSHDVHDCGPGGYGPWVKQAPVGILGLLYAHPYWRITVTDNGPVGITGAKVIDGAEPSCVSAAGTFDLAAGASKQVYCSTTVLLSLLPLTNTAAVKYTPANSPAGTHPTTTAGSSAKACSLLCLLI